jgi:DNA polymerase III delta prime subunit
MSNLQEVFNRIRDTKREQKELRKMYKDALDNSMEYKEITEKMENLKTRKKQIETLVKEDVGNNFKKLDALQMHVKTDTEMLSDIAINKLMVGEMMKRFSKKTPARKAA